MKKFPRPANFLERESISPQMSCNLGDFIFVNK